MTIDKKKYRSIIKLNNGFSDVKVIVKNAENKKRNGNVYF